MDGHQCAGFEFFSNFDSANIAKVEHIPLNESILAAVNSGGQTLPELPDVEFNIWTKPDCFGTQYENGNRTWFYFGMKANAPGLLVRINMVDLNRQAKMYSQGMAPVYRILPGRPHWDRIRDKPTYNITEDIFTLTFKYRTPENLQCITYFAFTYPYSYIDLQCHLTNLDTTYLNKEPNSKDDIYYHRECLCFSLEGRRVDLITVSSYHDISNERETRLANLFPDVNVSRPNRFIGKKVIFVSARVHPGETPSSFVFNGLLSLLLNREDPIAVILRKLYVFKLIPFLNPDGVAKGHYRTDTRGVNLNRVYLNPKLSDHPSVYAARALLRYYHFGYEKEETVIEDSAETLGNKHIIVNYNKLSKKVSHMTLEEKEMWCVSCKVYIAKLEKTMPGISKMVPTFNINDCLYSGENSCRQCGTRIDDIHGDTNCNESGLFLYIDMHGHASKKGIFMYGNHFEDLERSVECMLLPKILSLNNHNFHFTACNFTEKNMYLKDKRDGLSREGSGRVAVYKLTGLIRSYTLECNYNTGRLVNKLPPSIRESSGKTHLLYVPPKYTPHVFEEVGKALGVSILDLTGHNPITRLPNSEFRTLHGLREWLKINCLTEMGELRNTSALPKLKLRHTGTIRSQAKSVRAIMNKSRSSGGKATSKKIPNKTNRLQSKKIPIEKKENVSFPPNEPLTVQPCCSHSSSGSISSQRSRSADIPTSRQTKSKSNIEKTTKIEKSKSNQNSSTIKGKTTQLQKEKKKKTESDDTKRLQLREICFVKYPEGGKKVIAKYKTEKSTASDNNLIVAWDPNNTQAQVFSNQVFPTDGAGTSKQSSFRVHNFRRPVSRNIRGQKILRRLSAGGTDNSSKITKIKKRKPIKPKIV